jgi:ABC-type sugar transport system substrate-binding protein
MADNSLYQAEARDRLQALLLRKGELDARLAEAEARWMGAAEALEEAGQAP